jgi:hypothetical protein
MNTNTDRDTATLTGKPTGTWTTLTDNLQKNKSVESFQLNKILENCILSAPAIFKIQK